jgi:hypothetical protein
MGGTVSDAANNNAPIEGAALRLYRCEDETSVLVDSASTDEEGSYLFTDLTPEAWYYVEAVMSGPLTGKSPASGTTNPSALIGLGDSDMAVDFAFE